MTQDSKTPAAIVVTVPRDSQMKTEPAEVIAKFRSLKIALAAVLAIAGITLSPEVSESADIVIQSGTAAVFAAYSIWSAIRQGVETRNAVYSPATVERIAEAADTNGEIAVVTGDPKNAVV